MTKCLSDIQRRANIQNAKKSTGPRTEKGKNHSAKNAVKHGLLAKDVVVSTRFAAENKADFDALFSDLIADLKPRDLIEETLVERIATCYWRLSRVQRFELGAFLTTLESPDDKAKTLDRLRKKIRDTCATLAVEERLTELLAKPADQRTSDETRELDGSLQHFRETYFLNLINVSDAEFKEKLPELMPQVVDRLRARVEKLRVKLSQAEQAHALHRSRKRLIASLPGCEDVLRLVRYETMLDRQIHRALEALQRLRRRRPRKVPAHGTSPKRRLGPRRHAVATSLFFLWICGLFDFSTFPAAATTCHSPQNTGAVLAKRTHWTAMLYKQNTNKNCAARISDMKQSTRFLTVVGRYFSDDQGIQRGPV